MISYTRHPAYTTYIIVKKIFKKNCVWCEIMINIRSSCYYWLVQINSNQKYHNSPICASMTRTNAWYLWFHDMIMSKLDLLRWCLSCMQYSTLQHKWVATNSMKVVAITCLIEYRIMIFFYGNFYRIMHVYLFNFAY